MRFFSFQVQQPEMIWMELTSEAFTFCKQISVQGSVSTD